MKLVVRNASLVGGGDESVNKVAEVVHLTASALVTALGLAEGALITRRLNADPRLGTIVDEFASFTAVYSSEIASRVIREATRHDDH